MSGPSCHRWRAWERRAETLHRKAMDLQTEIYRAVGPEHEATDYGDSVVDMLEHLSSVLSRAANEAKSIGRRS